MQGIYGKHIRITPCVTTSGLHRGSYEKSRIRTIPSPNRGRQPQRHQTRGGGRYAAAAARTGRIPRSCRTRETRPHGRDAWPMSERRTASPQRRPGGGRRRSPPGGRWLKTERRGRRPPGGAERRPNAAKPKAERGVRPERSGSADRSEAEGAPRACEAGRERGEAGTAEAPRPAWSGGGSRSDTARAVP